MAGYGVFLLYAAFLASDVSRRVEPKKPILAVAKLKGNLIWRRNQFCRGWLITGDTGSGKTSSGINQLAHQVFQNEPTWGGCAWMKKASIGKRFPAMARHYGRAQDSDSFANQDKRRQTLHGYRQRSASISPATAAFRFPLMAKFVVDTATSPGQGGDKGFFKSQAQTHIAHALELLFELSQPVTLTGAFILLSNKIKLMEELKNLKDLFDFPRRQAVPK